MNVLFRSLENEVDVWAPWQPAVFEDGSEKR
jgi:hypothetical protein